MTQTTKTNTIPTSKRLARKTAALLAAACLTGGALAAGSLLAPAAAYAEDAPFSFEMSTQLVEGDPVEIHFDAAQSLLAIEVEVERKKGGPLKFSRNNVAAGERVTFQWDHGGGTQTYNLSVRVTPANGGDPFVGSTSFDVSMVSPMGVQIDFKNTNLESGTLALVASRAPSRIEGIAYADGKRAIDQFEADFDGKKKNIAVSWTPDGSRVVFIDLKVYDDAGTWSEVQVFRLDIAGAQVVFDTNKADIRDDQVDKLETTLAAINKELSTYDSVSLELYVAGYTDTVGSADKNRDLSERRARSIAYWFRKNGLKIPIYYQGFGEDVLAVPTGDNVDNEANRRIIYTLSNTTPGISDEMPRDAWKAVK